MQFRFGSADLEALYKEGGKGESRYSPDTVMQFIKLMQIIRAARDERDLRAFKGRRLEKLQGNLQASYAMRINNQFRLIFRLDKEEITIDAIEDYH